MELHKRVTWDEGAQSSQHGPSGVQDLQLRVPVKVFLLPAQLQDVIGIVPRRFASLIGIIVVVQRSKPLWSLWAIPWAASSRAQ